MAEVATAGEAALDVLSIAIDSAESVHIAEEINPVVNLASVLRGALIEAAILVAAVDAVRPDQHPTHPYPAAPERDTTNYLTILDQLATATRHLTDAIYPSHLSDREQPRAARLIAATPVLRPSAQKFAALAAVALELVQEQAWAYPPKPGHPDGDLHTCSLRMGQELLALEAAVHTAGRQWLPSVFQRTALARRLVAGVHGDPAPQQHLALAYRTAKSALPAIVAAGQPKIAQVLAARFGESVEETPPADDAERWIAQRRSAALLRASIAGIALARPNPDGLHQEMSRQLAEAHYQLVAPFRHKTQLDQAARIIASGRRRALPQNGVA